MKSADHFVKATVTVNDDESATVAAGSDVAVVITPATGWYVSACTGITSCPENGFSGNVQFSEDTAISVTFAKYLNVNVSAEAGGTVKLGDAADKDSVTVKSGDTVKVTVTPSTNHWISSVSGHVDLDYSEANKTGYTKTLTINEDTTISASFVEFFTVTVTCGENGTGLLNDDGATGILESDDAPTGLLSADDDTGIMNDAGTDDGSIKNSAHYPSLFRVLTQETIQIDKPVFRLGKERSYVDYFIASNNAVSRSHADVLTRGSRFFVIDLNSTNKTYINGNPLLAQCETEIYDGDRLTLGNEEFVFNSRE